MHAVGSSLYIGLSNNPGNYNGALITRSANGSSYTTERVLDEQGVHDFQYIDGEIYVPGTDPTDDWTYGNLYKRNTSAVWSKIRSMPNVIHALGLYHDGTNLFIAVGAHTGDNATWKGRVLRSTDDGATWAMQTDVNDYRLYDVISYSSRLYATGYNWIGLAYTQNLHTSSDNGSTWSTVSGVTPAIKPRMITFGGNLIVAGSSSLYQIDSSHVSTTRQLPFVIADNWNVLTTDNVYLYALDSIGYVWKSTNLIDWTQHTYVDNAIAISYWSNVGLMIADLGTSARIWKA